MALAYSAIGWDMYDPRMTLKAVTAEAITMGTCCWIDTDGLVYLTDNGEDRIHGCALTTEAAGNEIVLVTHGRLKVVDTNTIGALIYGQQNAGGSVPNTTTTGQICGFSIEATLLFVHIDSPSAT